MKTIDQINGLRRRTHVRRPSEYPRRRSSGESTRRRIIPQLEPLENRSLLSDLTLSGFPARGFRAERLDGVPPWNVAAIVDGEAIAARGFAELTESMTDAPSVAIALGDSDWFAGIVGDTRLRDADSATNDVDLYRLDLPAGSHYAINLQVIAQRFGSELDAAVSLLDSAGQLIASNDDALSEGFLCDAELYTGLDGGTYFVAVTAGGNTPGLAGLDPLAPVSGSGSRGTTGQYLLRLTADVDVTRPEVVRTSIDAGATLLVPPTAITVQFSEPMNLDGLQQGATLSSSSGTPIRLSAVAYESLTHEVTYVLRDRPVAGDYEFTLHAGQVTDRANNPVQSGGSGGDYTLRFHLDTPALAQVDTESNETVETAQQLGPLFASELRSGVQISGVVSTAVPGGDRDFYRFQVTRAGLFTFRLRPDSDTSQHSYLKLHDASGVEIARAFRLPLVGSTLFRWLVPGEYLVQMNGSGNGTGGSYQLTIQASFGPEVPLTDNVPAASVQVVLRTRDGERLPVETQPSSTQTTTTMVIDPMRDAVSSLQPVASQPVGGPRPESAGSAVAWVDPSGDGEVLPAGFALGTRTQGAVAQFSVDGVSGTFHASLPDEIPHGIHPLEPSTQLVSELAALVRRGAGEGASGGGAASAGNTGLGTESSERQLRTEPDEFTEESDKLAVSPPTLAFGMVASLGAVGAMNAPKRSRSSNLVQRAFEWLNVR